MDNAIALGIQPLKIDVATPLMQAAKIRQEQLQTQQADLQMRRDAIGAEARGLAPYVGKPEFDQLHAAAGERLMSQGILNTPQAVNGWATEARSPIGIQSLIARTEKPELALHREQFAETQKQHAQTYGLEQAKFEEEKRKTGVAEAAPLVVPAGAEAIRKNTGETVHKSEAGKIDAETVDAMARQLIAGDTTVLANLGRGAQGGENVIAVRKRVAEINKGSGESGTEQAMRNAEFMGVKAGQRTLGTKQANIEMAATEFKQVLPVVREASAAVSRTSYPDLNKIIQAFEQKTGDPKIVAFGGGVNTLVNLYSRAISPSGTPTVSDKEHAREILGKAWSQGQFDAAVGMMEREIDAALNSPEKVRDDMRKRFLGGQGGASHAPTGGAAPAGGALIAVDQQALDWANSNSSDPRAAAIKQRLGVK